MPNNLHTYHKTLQQLQQWLPNERITRMRNMALLMLGLQLSSADSFAVDRTQMAIAGQDSQPDESTAPLSGQSARYRS